MKKTLTIISVLIILVLMLFILTGCGKTASTERLAKDADGAMLNATDIINLMKAEFITENNTPNYNAPIYEIVTYTEKTDPNNLLGRPNQYTSKANFSDIRILTTDDLIDHNIIGGTVEVFNNTEDLQKRKSYIESITSSASVFAEYSYSKYNVLLRLDKKLTSEQAKEYEEIFYKICDIYYK